MSKRCVILAVDDSPSLSSAISTIQTAMEGPIGPYVAYIKGNDIFDSLFAHPLIAEISSRYPSLGLMVDRKLADVSATCKNIINRYTPLHPRGKGLLATVSVQSASPTTFEGLRTDFPKMLIAAMGIPTDWTKEQCKAYFGCLPATCMRRWLQALQRFTETPQCAIASYDMLAMMQEQFTSITCITPGVRDKWMAAGHQVRITGAYEALMAGSKYLVMGAQLTKGNPATGVTVEQSQQMTADRIKAALADLRKAA